MDSRVRNEEGMNTSAAVQIENLPVDIRELREAIRKEMGDNPVFSRFFLKEKLTDTQQRELYLADLKNGKWHVVSEHPLSEYLRADALPDASEAKGRSGKFSDQVLRARRFAANLQQREDSIRAIIGYVLEHETEYACGGKKAGEMTMSEVAAMLDLHLSTVRAACHGVFVKTYAGVYSLDSFFTSDPEESEEVYIGESALLDPEGKEPVSEICLIAPTEELAELTKEVCRSYGKHVDVCFGMLSNAVSAVKRLHERGAKIFISRRGTRKQIVEQCPWPVVDIGPDLTDYVPYLQKAAAAEGKVAFFSYGIIQEEVRIFCDLMGIDALFYSFFRADQSEGIVREALEDGAVLGIGGANTAAAAKKLGLPHLVTENSRLSLLKAIESAEQLLALQKEEAGKQEKLKILVERYDLALSFTHDAIFAIGADGRIEVMNNAAVLLAGAGGEKAAGRMFREMVPDARITEVLNTGKRELNYIIRMHGNTYNANMVPIVVDEQVKGALATYQDVKEMQRDEQNVRMKLSEKGLVARHHFEDIVGVSPKLQSAVRMAKRFAAADATVLLHGETGTGKELFAQSIHNASSRAEGPFVAVNCGALPKDILEAELFGYTEGAFTGARKGGKMGLFEMAHNGTIFLDEIGEMPMETQVQLLRVLQEREIRRLGSDRVTPVNIRVIAATNRNLLREIAEGRFRQDLFFRINVLNIEIPPLRDRREDIGPICEALLSQLMPCGPEERQLISKVLEERRTYDWPGNVRQLSNLAERLFVLRMQGEDKEFISSVLGNFSMENEEEAGPGREQKNPVPRKDGSAAVKTAQGTGKSWEVRERERYIEVLEETGYEITAAAGILGIDRSTLWRKMKALGIDNLRRRKRGGERKTTNNNKNATK